MPYKPVIQHIVTPETDAAGVHLYISREDLNSSLVQGNKYHKLKLNLQAATEQGHDTLLTFGGAFSNHIYATAMAGKQAGLKTIGVIRGEATHPLNPTLQAATQAGMTLYYIDRSTYRHKDSDQVLQLLTDEFGDFYLLPEGGTNALAVKGCQDMVSKLPISFQYVALAAGTGGTSAGVISGMAPAQGQAAHVMAFSALKGDFLQDDIACLLEEQTIAPGVSWELVTDYHFGGYAKLRPELARFIRDFRLTHHIQLEPVYSGKMLYGLVDMIKKGRFKRNDRILAIHTGGLQGLEGMRQRFGDVF